MTAPITNDTDLLSMRRFFESGATKPYDFRKRQLVLLKQAILRYEPEIFEALYTDLKKSPEETYSTETGLILSELNYTIKNLHRWMRPRRLKNNLVNFPSSGKLYYDPLGVTLIISPWNYPLQLLLIPLIGAIAGGNCAVLKPSELAPATAGVAEKIINAIYPEHYVKVVQGDGAAIVPDMMRRFRFNHVFYTGSIPVGKTIYQLAAKDLVPVTLELGGKSPAIIEKDADIVSSARRIALGKFINAGQTCIAPDYLLVHADIAEKFIAALKATILLFWGEDARENYDYGKIINEKHFNRLLKYLHNGELVMGGQTNPSGLFIAPTILINVALDSPVMEEEIFGPILPVCIFKTMEDALQIIKKNENPLACYVFTSSKKKEKAWMESIAFGGGCINNTAWHFANHSFPFGGVGNSGIGAYHGRHSFFTFTHAKAVMKTPVWFDPDIKYPPLKGKLKWLKLFIR
ncbi:aldehyde dehydrogenase [Agriterribacter sp.]|uniref:aldehyde dehydrogenase n=1 Tax=Agriterribacter sp. TaxID=2821509 RepID=UPI002BBDF6E2|nr:aldehyde dehydrogenase [Agriterribacter sp.]HTN08919.1 aldehyde dehydrogenase [Agriterribacter sp.]